MHWLKKLFNRTSETTSERISNTYWIETNSDSLSNNELYNIEDMFDKLEPATDSFRLNKSQLLIVDVIKKSKPNLESNFTVQGMTKGSMLSTNGLEMTVPTSNLSVLTHELGHVADRYSDGNGTRPFSTKEDFDPIFIKYLNVLRNSDIDLENQMYLHDPKEAFALLFEHYCKENFPDNPLTQTPTKFANTFEKLYQEPEVKQYFNDTMKFLYSNFGKELNVMEQTNSNTL